MKNKSNNNISPESDDTEDINLLLDDFKTALKKEYIIPIINKMIYIIQNNVTSEIIDELNFIHNHSLIKVAKMHDQLEYLKFLQEHVNPYINLFNRLTYKEMKLFCLNKVVKISNQNI
jgi:hypothetical protein